ncbi:MAG: hypothetical protein QOK00_1985, partial [Thermoleophilaceae bacterium]|nr:hypothetical protein [Thermoleophilaceae bacterium]
MIRPEQLAEALDRIHPRDRELLSLSLRRRVPDEALGRLYECSPSEVARRRARAIERLADEMQLHRGEDLGAVLKALLEPETWSQTAMTLGEEFAAGGARSRLAAVPVPEEEPERDDPFPALAPVPPPPDIEVAREREAPAEAEAPPAEAEVEAAPAAEQAEAAPPAEATPATAEAAPAAEAAPEEAEAAKAEAAKAEAAPEPGVKPAEVDPAPAPVPTPDSVLEMFAERERQAPDPPRRAVPLALIGLAIAALVGAAGVVGA